MFRKLHVGGAAALFEAAAFLFGFVLATTLLSDYVRDPTPIEAVAFVADHQTALASWYLVTLVAFGVALVPLVLVLHDHVKARAPEVARVAAVFGFIWAALVIASGMVATLGVGVIADLYTGDRANATAVWSALDAVQNGMGGGNEIVGGLWVLLVSAAAWRSATLPRGACVFGAVTGVAGILTTVPAWEVLGAVFGTGLIGWFVWVGVVLIQCGSRANRATAPSDDVTPALVRR
jgi:hypothetical protein